VTALEWDADGDADAVVRAWDVASGQERRHLCTVPRADVAPTIRISPDGRFVANVFRDPSGNDAALVSLVDVASGNELHRIPLPAKASNWSQGVFTPDGNILVLGDGKSFVLRDTASGKQLVQVHSPWDQVCAPAISADGTVVAAVARDDKGLCRVQLWRTDTGASLNQLAVPCHHGTRLLFAPDGRTLAASVDQGHVVLFDVATGKERRRFPCGLGLPLAFTGDGRTLVIGKYIDGDIQLWEVSTGKVRCRFKGHRASVACATFTPDGRKLISGSYDQTILVWDVAGTESGRALSPNLQPERPSR